MKIGTGLAHLATLLGIGLLAAGATASGGNLLSDSISQMGLLTLGLLTSGISFPFSLHHLLSQWPRPILPWRSGASLLLLGAAGGLMAGLWESQKAQPDGSIAVNLIAGILCAILPALAWFFLLHRLAQQVTSSSQKEEAEAKAQWIRQRFLVLLLGSTWFSGLVGFLVLSWSSYFFRNQIESPLLAGYLIGFPGAAILALVATAPALFLWGLYQSTKIK